MTNKLPELAKACWIQPEYVTTGADGNPEYVYSDSIMAFYMEVRHEALLEALEACENAMVSGDRIQPYSVYCTACCDCAEAIKKLIKEI